MECRANSRLRVELRPVSVRGEAIERTNILTHIAAEHPIADTRSKLSRDLAFVFNRQIRDALPRVQLVRSREGVRRARVEAAPARTAADLYLNIVGRKIEIEKYL